MRQSDLFDDLPKWFVCYAKLRARVVRKIRRVIRRMIIEEQPTIGVPQIIGNAVNLCETCKYDFPECPKDSNVIFGDGKGNDNVCACSAYEVYVPPISKREWYQKGYEAGVKSVQPQRWIPVAEALPDRYIVGGDGKHYSLDVLMTVIYRDEDIFIDYGQMVDDEWYSEMNNEIITSPFEVVAWMPLPKPWEGQNETRGVSETP